MSAYMGIFYIFNDEYNAYNKRAQKSYFELNYEPIQNKLQVGWSLIYAKSFVLTWTLDVNQTTVRLYMRSVTVPVPIT